VIARREADPVRRPECFDEGARGGKFRCQPDIDHVPGQGDVIRRMGVDVVANARQRLHVMRLRPAAPPVHPAGDPLAGKLAQARRRQGANVCVGQMGNQHGRRSDPGKMA